MIIGTLMVIGRSEGFPRTRITKSSCACDCGRKPDSVGAFFFFLLNICPAHRSVPRLGSHGYGDTTSGRETTGEDTAAVCRWLASQVRRLLKQVELLENPRLL